MKKIFTLAFLVISLISQGQEDRIKQKQASLSAPTEIGKPDGELTSQKIGKDGGTLISSDNKITLIIPPGALSSETLISIQPTTNFAKESMGKSYQLEPSGIQFQKPAQLVFNYTDKELDGQSPELMGVGWQNDKGEWKGIRKTNLDKNSKKITANIKHFSGFVLWWAIILTPEKTRIKVSTEMNVFLSERNLEDAPNEEPSEQILNLTAFTSNKNWSVEDIPGGNGTVGHIQPFDGAPPTVLSRLYKAPAQVPDNNPVEIKIEITDSKLINPNPKYANETYPNTTRKCKVKIYDDEYEVKMIATMKGGSRESWAGNMTYRDEGSFIVSLDKKEPEVIDIKNNLEVLNYDNCPDRIITNPTTNTGIFHVAGIKQIKVTAANPPGQPFRIVEIWFEKYPIEGTRFTFNCPPPPSTRGNSKGKVDLLMGGMPSPLLMFMGMPAIPPYIKFIAKEGEQTIIEQGRPGGELYYKVSLRKINDD